MDSPLKLSLRDKLSVLNKIEHFEPELSEREQKFVRKAFGFFLGWSGDGLEFQLDQVCATSWTLENPENMSQSEILFFMWLSAKIKTKMCE